MILMLAGEWYAAFSVIGAVLVGAGWKPFKRFRDRAKVRQRLRDLCR